jgi:PadR family transcriptional regulator PadR
MILRLLESEPMYGYQMIQHLRDRSKGYFQLGEGALYPLLHELEASGFLTGRWVEVEEQPQRRKYYSLTAKGRREFARRKDEWKGFARALDRVLEASRA